MVADTSVKFSPNIDLVSADLKNPTMVSFLDGARWLAAALVFIGHLRNPLFLGFDRVEPKAQSSVVKAWYFVSGMHAEAVIVFFVLSGLLVAGVGLSRVHSSTFRISDYAIDRFSRLYVAFIPALLVGYFCDCVGRQVFSEIGYWNGSHPMIAAKIATGIFEEGMSLSTLVLNSVMLQHYWALQLGSNQPLWTISTEFWFYVAFGLAMIIATAQRKYKIVASVLLFLQFVFLGNQFLVYLGCWLIGMAIVFFPRIGRTCSILFCLAFAATVVAARAAHSLFEVSDLLREVKNYAVAITFALVVASMRGKSIAPIALCGKLNRFFADFSYSLYLLHFPLMLFLLASLNYVFHLKGVACGYSPNSREGVAVYLLVIVTVYAMAWGFSRLTEAKTATVRHFLKSYSSEIRDY